MQRDLAGSSTKLLNDTDPFASAVAVASSLEVALAARQCLAQTRCGSVDALFEIARADRIHAPAQWYLEAL